MVLDFRGGYIDESSVDADDAENRRNRKELERKRDLHNAVYGRFSETKALSSFSTMS